MPRSSPEHIIQSAFFTEVRYKIHLYPHWKAIFAIPNSGRRSKWQGHWLQQEGMMAGVWDVFCCFPRGEYHGLWIETKAGKNGLTESQKTFRAAIEPLGYKFVVCRSSEQMIHELMEYERLQ